jgi:hypothetical protein
VFNYVAYTSYYKFGALVCSLTLSVEKVPLSSAGGEIEKLGEEQERCKFLGLNQLDYTLKMCLFKSQENPPKS